MKEFNLKLWWKKGFITEKVETYLMIPLVFFLLEFTCCCTLHTESLEHTHYKYSDYKEKLECFWT